MMKKILLLACCLFGLSACSAKLAYNFLGLVFNWQIGKYVSLNSEQQRFTDAKIEAFHHWHRATQLPLYADYIDSLLQRLERDAIDADWVHAETDRVQDLLDLSVTQLKPDIVQLMGQFSDKQVNEILHRFSKERKKYRRKYIEIDEEKRFKQREEEIYDRLGPFFGRFSDAQKERIATWARHLLPYETLSEKQQLAWAEELRTALALRADSAALAAALDRIMFYRTDDWDPELEKILDTNQALTYDLIAELINTQSPQQHARMRKKLGEYREDLWELHRQGR